MWSFVRVVFGHGGPLSGWSLVIVVFSQGGSWSRWSLVRVVFCQDGPLSGWSLVRVVLGQSGPWSGIMGKYNGEGFSNAVLKEGRYLIQGYTVACSYRLTLSHCDYLRFLQAYIVTL